MTKRFRKIKLSTATNAYDLLTDVSKAILEEPRRVDMGTWFKRVTSKTFRPESGRLADGRRTYVSTPACGTVGCIAGWMRTLTVPSFDPGDKPLSEVSNPARRMLCDDFSFDMPVSAATEKLRDHVEALFHGTPMVVRTTDAIATPYPFPNHRVGTKAYAKGVVANIRKFQAAFERELRARSIA